MPGTTGSDAAKSDLTLNAIKPTPDNEMATAAALTGTTFAKVSVKDVIPKTWEDRAKQATKYYHEEPLVSHGINAWRVFAVGEEIKITSDDENAQTEVTEMVERLKVNPFVQDMVLQLLVKGEDAGYFKRNTAGDDIEKLICINPISMSYTTDAEGEVVTATQNPSKGKTGTKASKSSKPIELAVDQLIRQKWNAPAFAENGNSMVLPAFESIELLRDYRNAERAIAKRWATPLRFIQVGGAYGQHVIKPSEKMLEKIRKTIDSMDLESGLVVPWYVKAETYGTEGKALDVENKVSEAKEDIAIALGFARSLITGEDSNFATASINLQKFIIMLREIKRAASAILDWIMAEWVERKGFQKINFEYHFATLEIESEADIKKLFIELYDRGLVSKNTLQHRFGFNPENEDVLKEGEEIIVDQNWDIKDVASLVGLGILTADEARERLGLEGTATEAQSEAKKKSEALNYTGAPKPPAPARPL